MTPVSTIPEGYESGLVPALMLPIAAQVVRRAPVEAGALVLDAGAGTGAVARQIPRARVVALDDWDDMVAFAPRIVPAARWTLGTIERLPFRDARFDAAYCQHALPFAEEPSRAVRELARVTRPGGRVAIVVWTGLASSPGFAALGAATDGLTLRFEEELETADGLRGLLEGAGLAARVERLRHEARFASAAAFVRAYVAGSSLSERLDAAGEAEVARRVARVLGEGPVAFPVEAHVAVGVRDGAQL